MSVLNEEDIPHMLLTMLQFSQQHDTTIQEILLRIQNVVNDEGVQDIGSEYRKCIFPNEQFDSKYKYYSYSTCVTECLKQTQIRLCNCTHFNMIYDGLYLNNIIINNISTRYEEYHLTTRSSLFGHISSSFPSVYFLALTLRAHLSDGLFPFHTAVALTRPQRNTVLHRAMNSIAKLYFDQAKRFNSTSNRIFFSAYFDSDLIRNIIWSHIWLRILHLWCKISERTNDNKLATSFHLHWTHPIQK